MAKKKNPFAKLDLSWQRMKIGKFQYLGTYTGAKANVCRASKAYAPKKWRTFTEDDKIYIERLE